MFGLASAPRDLSLAIKKVPGLLRKRGMRCCFSIDDIIFFAQSAEEAKNIRLVALDLFYTLGFKVSWPKSLLSPGRIIRHLGLDVCSTDGSVWAPVDKVMRLRTSRAVTGQVHTTGTWQGSSYVCRGAGSFAVGDSGSANSSKRADASLGPTTGTRTQGSRRQAAGGEGL